MLNKNFNFVHIYEKSKGPAENKTMCLMT